MTITSLDFETANPSRVSICAAGMAVFEGGNLTESPYWLVRPPKGHGWFWESFIECHGLTHLDVLEAPEFPAIAPEFLARLIRADLVIAHNAAFDIGHLRDTLDHFGLSKSLHCAFDQGVFTISDQYEVIIHPKAKTAVSQAFLLLATDRKRIVLPADSAYHPHQEALAWHREHRFGWFGKTS